MSEKINVLLIQTSPGDAGLVGEALSAPSVKSYHVQREERLSGGLSRLAHPGFDVILLDLDLPDSPGLAALAAVRSSAANIPVVVLGTSEDEEFAIQIVQAGAQDYLVKQRLNQYTLTRALRYAIEREGREEALQQSEQPLLDEHANMRGAAGVFVEPAEDLRESEERLRLAMSAAHEAMWEYNMVSGVARWNETTALIFGTPPAASDPVAWWAERLHPDDAKRVWEGRQRALAGGGDAWEDEYRTRSADGSWRYVHDRAMIARDAAGRPVRMVGAALDITDRKQAEEALQAANRRFQQLSRDLLRTQDYERRRIARELHDSTSQLLAALSINLSRLQEPGLDPDRRRQALAEAIDLAAACATEIRTVTYLLHPPLLDVVGLRGALEAYAQGFKQRTGIEIEIKTLPDFGRLDSEMEATLFRIAQEGLANVHQHSGSRIAVIRLERDSSEVRLVLQDRGRGFPNGQAIEKGFVGFGVGIIGMRERAERLGGRLEFTSNESGAKLTVTLPLVHSDEKNESSLSR